jgi:hypothetical protein
LGVDAAALAAYRRKHAGATIVVCGCGESLPELTQPQRFVTIGVNDVGRLFDPTYLVVVNPRAQFLRERFRYVEESNAAALFTQLDLGRVRPRVVRFKLGRFGGTDDSDYLHYTQNSPYVAVCLAAYMGAQRIGLIGVDFTNDHFFARTGPHALGARLREIDGQYGRLAAALKQRGIELVNLSRRSRLISLPKADLARLGDAAREACRDLVPTTTPCPRVVSYATTPVAGVPAILARCITAATRHPARCVWAANGYANGVEFAGDVQWTRQPREAAEVLAAADVVIVHNGKIDEAHRKALAGKPLVTMAHNYGWNVDLQHVRHGHPGVVIGQYQATLPEFAGWPVVPNPLPWWEADYAPASKGERVVIAFTPSGRHERFPKGHRLYWHAKGYDTTMSVLERVARATGARVETTARGQVSHSEAVAMKRRAHIVIDECVTGSYHRNSLEGLAAGCVVVNGVGLLPGVVDALRRCAPRMEASPFVFSDLAGLERVLLELIARGGSALEVEGRRNREWIERHWSFADQWAAVWQPVLEDARERARGGRTNVASLVKRNSTHRSNKVVTKPLSRKPLSAPVSVIVPHGGADRLMQLQTALVTLRQRAGVGEIIVVELGTTPCAKEVASRWADKHLFVEHGGEFERARALNAGETVAKHDVLLWHDNDLLSLPSFVVEAVKELRERALDYLIPCTSVRYLTPADTQAVMQGARNAFECVPSDVLRGPSVSGNVGLVERAFVRRHGGLIEGFRGWGGEDNAWNHKVAVLGRIGHTRRLDQHIYHLYHRHSGGTEPGAAANANPHYADNVRLMQRIMSLRNPAELRRQFPARSGAAGALTVFATAPAATSDGATVWSYWEGPCPAWIHACRRSIVAAAPRVRVLSRQQFDELWDADRDIDLSRLGPAQRADFIRMFLLQRYGGLWVDADCLVMQPLQPILDLLARHDMVGHRERSGLVSNGFLGARAGSRLARRVYERVCAILRSRRPLGWTTIGSEPLSAEIAADASGWHELPCARVQPICWSRPAEFFVERDRAAHESVRDHDAICYMLSNTEIRKHLAGYPKTDLMRPATFFSHVLRHACGAASAGNRENYEQIFTTHADLYRQHNDESISGPGSSLAQTQVLRERLPLVLAQLGVRSLLDAPCGDYNWLKHVRLGIAEYIGADVLTEVVAENQARHGDSEKRFIRADLLCDSVPTADLVLCRDLLPHLSYEEILAVLRNLRRSGATYLLTTTFTQPRPNQDTSGGRWRTLNLWLPPFNFPAARLTINEGCTEAGGAYADKSLALWELSDLPLGDDRASVPPRARRRTLDQSTRG